MGSMHQRLLSHLNLNQYQTVKCNHSFIIKHQYFGLMIQQFQFTVHDKPTLTPIINIWIVSCRCNLLQFRFWSNHYDIFWLLSSLSRCISSRESALIPTSTWCGPLLFGWVQIHGQTSNPSTSNLCKRTRRSLVVRVGWEMQKSTSEGSCSQYSSRVTADASLVWWSEPTVTIPRNVGAALLPKSVGFYAVDGWLSRIHDMHSRMLYAVSLATLLVAIPMLHRVDGSVLTGT